MRRQPLFQCLTSGDSPMRTVDVLRSLLILAAALTTVMPAAAQTQPPRPGPPPPAAPQRPQTAPQGGPPAGPAQTPAAAPIKPYKPLAVTLPGPVNDPSFEAF